MADQIDALIAKAKEAAERERYFQTGNAELLTRLTDRLSAAHTVIEEAKVALHGVDFAAVHTVEGLAVQAALDALSKYPSGEEDGR